MTFSNLVDETIAISGVEIMGEIFLATMTRADVTPDSISNSERIENGSKQLRSSYGCESKSSVVVVWSCKNVI